MEPRAETGMIVAQYALTDPSEYTRHGRSRQSMDRLKSSLSLLGQSHAMFNAGMEQEKSDKVQTSGSRQTERGSGRSGPQTLQRSWR